MFKIFRKTIALLAIVFFCFCFMFTGKLFAADMSDEAVLGNNRWSVQSDGDFVPNTTAAYDIGGASNYVDNAYITTLYTTSSTLTSADINGGTIDGTVIGGSSAAAGTFTTLTGQGYLRLDTPLVGIFSLPLNSFLNSVDASPLTASTAPGLEIDNVLPEINWADGETTPVMVTFRVPDDYLSGGGFRLFCDSSNSATPEQVDFDVYVNSTGSAWDAAATNQTPVALAQAAGTPETVTLSVATDFSGLAAGKYVTLRLWRDDVSTGTGDLEVYYVSFYYNRK